MRVEPEQLFEPLAPPPGGAAALRSRLRHERSRVRKRRATLGLASALALAGILVATRSRTPEPRLSIPDEIDPALVSLGLQAPPTEPAVIARGMRHRMALQRAPLETDRVVFYYLAVLPETTRAAQPGDDRGQAVESESRGVR